MSWYEAMKDAAKLVEGLRNAELTQKMLDVRVEGAKLAEENARLREERNELRDKLQLRSKMKFDANVYWRTGEGGEREGPFCPGCLDGSDKAVWMEDRPDDHYWRCTVCPNIIEKPGQDPSD